MVHCKPRRGRGKSPRRKRRVSRARRMRGGIPPPGGEPGPMVIRPLRPVIDRPIRVESGAQAPIARGRPRRRRSSRR